MSKEFPYIGNVDDYLSYEDYEDGEFGFTLDDIKKLKAIESGSDIKTLKVGEDWYDDHEICVNLTVNEVEFSALWIVPEFYADIIYAGKGVEEGKDSVARYISDLMKDVDLEKLEALLNK